jgi:hypothetical protein
MRTIRITGSATWLGLTLALALALGLATGHGFAAADQTTTMSTSETEAAIAAPTWTPSWPATTLLPSSPTTWS